MNEVSHIPVALNRCIDLLSPGIEKAIAERGSAVVIDATLGLGGHTRAVFDEIESALQELNIDGIDGALFDLGVSSMQLDIAERGFAYSQDAPLDMRMDQSQGLTAHEILQTYEKSALVRILRAYGDEKFAPRIVDNIIDARSKGGVNSTKALAELIKESIPAAARRTGGNPAKRTFQALRIEVNQELAAVEVAIPAAMKALRVNARIVVMSYQSLEDKIVKSFFADACASKTPRGLPVELPNSQAKFIFVINGSESAPESEVRENPRAQSMRLRAIEKVAA